MGAAKDAGVKWQLFVRVPVFVYRSYGAIG
jgi:hypothetical protein